MTESPPADGALEALLEYVNERRAFDFRGYKRASLSRRILKRMQAVGAEDYQSYIDVLEANPGEFAQLFDTILINVTAFLRDPESWEYLAGEVIARVVAGKSGDDPIRVWSAGCASGEEAYSLAVLLTETLGEERFRRAVKIYATDADNDALTHARHARYPESALLQAFGEDRTKEFFELDGTHGVFRQELRRSLIFGRHDLVQDPPISRIDLLVCRNTLMYFTAEVQRQILASFYFALNASGYLFLGKSESLVARTELFEVVDLRRHVFRKNGSEPWPGGAAPIGLPRLASSLRDRGRRLADAVFEQSAIAQITVDFGGAVTMANRQARRLLGLGSNESGRLLPPSLSSTEVPERIEQALRERRPVIVNDMQLALGGGAPHVVDMTVQPLDDHVSGSVALVTFSEVGRFKVLREQLERSQRDLGTAYEELQSAVEELETTNEELQSTNEELETTNEELHSTNEELETMNEELQSTNEELETINNELRDRTNEVEHLNQFLQSILGGIRTGVVVLDTDMCIQAWNHEAEDLWGLRSSEVVGQHFLNLDIGFPVGELRAPIRDCLLSRAAGLQSTTCPAVNRRGRAIRCSVTITPLVGEGRIRGVIVLMENVGAADGAGAANADATAGAAT